MTTKVGEMEYNESLVISKGLMKDVVLIFQYVGRDKSFIILFQYGQDKDMTTDQIKIVSVEKGGQSRGDKTGSSPRRSLFLHAISFK